MVHTSSAIEGLRRMSYFPLKREEERLQWALIRMCDFSA